MTRPVSIDSFVRAGLDPRARVLDLGCGTGRHARALAAAGFRVVAADTDFDAVSTARELSGAETGTGPDDSAPRHVLGRAESLPFRDASFDALLCLDVLHWAADTAAFDAMWNEIWRVIRPGGLLCIRCLCLDFSPSAAPLGSGRFRLASGAEWFLPDAAGLHAGIAHAGGEWVEAPRQDGTGSFLMMARKPVRQPG